MIQINLTDEQYQLLCKCQELLKTQDNRITENPIFGFIYDDELPTNEEINVDKHIWVEYDSGEYYTFKNEHDMYQYLIGNYEEKLKEQMNIDTDYSGELDFGCWLEELIENADFEQIENIVEIRKIAIQKVEKIYDNCFSFFEQDVKDHYQMNSHNMPEGINKSGYAFSNFRTPMMNDLRKLLIEVKLDD